MKNFDEAVLPSVEFTLDGKVYKIDTLPASVLAQVHKLTSESDNPMEVVVKQFALLTGESIEEAGKHDLRKLAQVVQYIATEISSAFEKNPLAPSEQK